MNCNGDPYVIEYNVRMGDPETEAVLPRIESDLLSHFLAMGKGCLSDEKIMISNSFSLALVAVSGGYPAEFSKGFPINIAGELDSLLFHSGTSSKEGTLVTSGGRVLVVSAKGESIESARERAYENMRKISFEGIYYRTDLGQDLLKYSNK
jgi:phosphoribosylamine--glycine ligase